MNYTPLTLKSHNSLLLGLPQPDHNLKRLQELGIENAALCDYANISGTIDFYKKLKGKIKQLLGCQFYICDDESTKQEKENRRLTHLNVIARNKAGWKNLIKLVSLSNHTDRFYYKPRLSLEDFKQYSEGLLCFSGGFNSYISGIEANKANAESRLNKLVSVFGKDNTFLEAQLFGVKNFGIQKELTEVVRELGAKTKLKIIGTPAPHYCKREDVYDHRILLCSLLGTTLPQVQYQLQQEEDVALAPFFNSDDFFLPAYSEMLGFGHTEEELENTNLVASLCEPYDILNKPILPQFKCPNGLNPDEYLRELCRDGWKRKIMGKIDKSKEQTYGDRVKYELGVLQGAGLSSYFLILNDIIRWVHSKGWLTGTGRGSAAGCLVSYLLDITEVDPIPYDLMFERFYNAGRNTKDRIAMPDIDADIPSSKRDEVIQYISSKYGASKVCQICNFQTMKGRGSINEVFRAYGNTSFETVNKITEPIPDESKIIDDLQKMKEEEDESSIIRWTLENEGKKLADYCRINDRGELEGPYAKRFEQAIRLEGTRKSYGKHASGVVISIDDMETTCPMFIDKKNNGYITAWEMRACEDVGLTKLDVLGIKLLDKVQGVVNILRSGDI